MLRLIVGCTAAALIVCGALYSRGHVAALTTMVSAPMLAGQAHAPATPAKLKMDKCYGVTTTASESGSTQATAANLIASTVNDPTIGGPIAATYTLSDEALGKAGTGGKLFWVATDKSLSTKDTQGGCQCGSAICTVGRICLEATSSCILPPCPYDGLTGLKVGQVAVPDEYTAGCWCAPPSAFVEFDIGGKTNGNEDSFAAGKAGMIPLLPSAKFSDPKEAVICKPKQFCSGDDSFAGPTCTAEARTR